MDKSKIGAILALVVLGGLLMLSNLKEPPAPGDGDHDHDQAQPTAAPAVNHSAQELSGGITKLKIEDQKVGTGAAAAAGDSLTMNYKGTLLTGEMFDQSYGREPFSFTLGAGQVIKGWDRGILGMKEGGKRKLTIPADLGYGPAGSPPKIPGGSTLVFEVELLKVNKPKK